MQDYFTKLFEYELTTEVMRAGRPDVLLLVAIRTIGPDKPSPQSVVVSIQELHRLSAECHDACHFSALHLSPTMFLDKQHL